MENDVVSLRWHNHLTILSQLLNSLREENYLVDVTLACEGKLFSAHKFVLSMSSDYFKEMFTANPCKHPIVFLKDVRSDDMNALLDFVYRGVAHVPQENLSSLLKTAEGLRIRGLGNIGRGGLVTSLVPQSATVQSAPPPQQQQPPPQQMQPECVPAPNQTQIESSLLLSPERKRGYDVDHDGTPLLGFSSDGISDNGFDVSLCHHPNSNSHPSPPLGHSPSKKSVKLENHPPAPIPDLPKVGEDKLELGGGVTINSADYYRFRRTNANRYVNDLLRYFFPLEILASSSLTGGECFANKDRGPSNKNQIDPVVIRVITHDTIRNFPTISEKQVRTAIRRKLNTESRIYRSLVSPSCLSRRRRIGSSKTRFNLDSRSQISIEKTEREKIPKGSILISTPNVTVEKAPQKEIRRQTSYGSPCHSQGSFMEGDKRDDEVSYFRSKPPTPPQHLHEQQQPTPNTPSSSTTPTPIATPTLPTGPAPSPQLTIEKSFSLVKSELPAGTQYIQQQEYTYSTVDHPHVSQAYLTHPVATTADPTYLRRLDLSQGSGQPLQLTSYYHTSIPTSESIEQNLHM